MCCCAQLSYHLDGSTGKKFDERARSPFAKPIAIRYTGCRRERNHCLVLVSLLLFCSTTSRHFVLFIYYTLYVYYWNTNHTFALATLKVGNELLPSSALLTAVALVKEGKWIITAGEGGEGGTERKKKKDFSLHYNTTWSILHTISSVRRKAGETTFCVGAPLCNVCTAYENMIIHDIVLLHILCKSKAKRRQCVLSSSCLSLYMYWNE